MAIFSANTSDMAYTGKVIRDLGEEYKNNITNIFSLIDNLGNKWSGEASNKYVTTFNSYKSDLNRLGDTISNMGIALSNAASTFDANEDDLKTQAGNL